MLPFEVKHTDTQMGAGLYATEHIPMHTAWPVEGFVVGTCRGDGYVFEMKKSIQYWLNGKIVQHWEAMQLTSVEHCFNWALSQHMAQGGRSFFRVAEDNIFMRINDGIYRPGMCQAMYEYCASQKDFPGVNVTFMTHLRGDRVGLVCVTTAPIERGSQLFTSYGWPFWAN